MYCWKIDALKKDLSGKSLPESESFKYLFVFVTAYSLAIIPSTTGATFWDIALVGASIVAEMLGLWYVYVCNKGKEGENFLQRYLALGWVVGVRWTVLCFFPVTIIFYGFRGAVSENALMTSWIDVVFFTILSLGYFWILGKHMKELASTKKVPA